MDWNKGTELPKPSKKDVICDEFLVVQKGNQTPELMCYYHEISGFFEVGWMDFDGNAQRVRLWMEVPFIPREI